MKRQTIYFSIISFCMFISLSILRVSAKSNLTDAFNDLFLIVSVISLVVFLFVLVLWLHFINKYRENQEPERGELSESFSKKLEIGWTFIAIIIVIFLMVASYPYLFNTIDNNEQNVLDISGEPSTEKVVVEGTGSWTWRFHLNGTINEPTQNEEGVMITEMTLEVGKPYTFVLWSSASLIHSFFVRELNFKQDVTPGTNNTFSIIIDEPGDYSIVCAEFCGPGHSLMRGIIHAEVP